MKFLADMGISPQTVVYVRGLGYDATHLSEEGLERLPDAAILAKARQENRIVLACDLDFADLLAASGASLPSVIIFRLRDLRPVRVNTYLDLVLAQHRTMLLRGAIISVTEAQVRVRALPIV